MRFERLSQNRSQVYEFETLDLLKLTAFSLLKKPPDFTLFHSSIYFLFPNFIPSDISFPKLPWDGGADGNVVGDSFGLTPPHYAARKVTSRGHRSIARRRRECECLGGVNGLTPLDGDRRYDQALLRGGRWCEYRGYVWQDTPLDLTWNPAIRNLLRDKRAQTGDEVRHS
jgi:hypothetical protein